ncbi:uncharacterized protein LOC116350353 [Contarinia nasturtii]|uniref:uncharacterized protein LOC116350353 n=1 Tax=Contarinia nasturtii TaxID=265458 RepID=UPI0012D40A06|nr:uncharacterized protein LOC116350353 [Contarinia nasturtii]
MAYQFNCIVQDKMKIFLFLTFSSLLLLVQINCEPVTFENVADSFRDKIKATKIKWVPNIDFMLKIYERKPNTSDLNLQDMIPFLSEEQRELYLSNVPNRMEVQGMPARTFISKQISEINFMQMKTFRKLHDAIITGLNFDSPSEYDNEFREPFDASFNEWNVKPFKKPDAELFKKSWPTMTAQYDRLKRKFDNVVKNVALLRQQANGPQIVNCRLSFAKMKINTDPDDVTSIINDELLEQLNEMKQKQSELAIQLQELKSIISRYNIQRTIWARFLIGTEKTPRLA